MAGSWDHITTKGGKFQGTLLIENLGDAWEALEECYGMVWVLADALARKSGTGVEPTRPMLLAMINQAAREYKDGVKLGGVAARTIFGE